MSVAMMSAVDWVCLFCVEKAVVVSRATTSWRGCCSLIRHGGWGGAEGAECVYVRGDDASRGLGMFVLCGNGSCRVESDNVGVRSQSKEGRNFVDGLEDGATVVL